MTLTELAKRVDNWRRQRLPKSEVERRVRSISARRQALLVTEIAVERLLRDSGGEVLPPEHADSADMIWCWVAPGTVEEGSIHAYQYVPTPAEVVAGPPDDPLDEQGDHLPVELLMQRPDAFARALAWRRRQVAEAQGDVDELLWLWANRNDEAAIPNRAVESGAVIAANPVD